MALFKVLSWYLHGSTQENEEELHYGELVHG
jgi:hypothetical protein